MRRQRGLIGLMGLAALVGWGIAAEPAMARITTEQSASILVFPKVIANGTRDTIIQITNTSNNMRHAHCFYVNAALTDPTRTASGSNPPLWTEIDFDIWLTKQQPTHWVVSKGRLDNPTDAACSRPISADNCDPATVGGVAADCCDTGFDPGRVPPVVPDFTGELKCIEVDASGFPVPGNALKGEATLEDLATGDISKYNALGLKGFDTNNMDGVLCLGGGVTDLCPTGAEYEACPQAWLLDHSATGAANPAVVNSTMETNLTVVPCTENFETQTTPPVTMQFAITNEFEQTFSASTTVNCWASYDLGQDAVAGTNPFGGINTIFSQSVNGGSILLSRLRSAAGTPRGVFAVLEETTRITGTALGARSAQNAHMTFDDQSGQDLITIPADQITAN